MLRVQRTESVLDVPHDGNGDRHESFDARKRDVLPRKRGRHPLHTASGKRFFLLFEEVTALGNWLASRDSCSESHEVEWCRAAPDVAFVNVSITTYCTIKVTHGSKQGVFIIPAKDARQERIIILFLRIVVA